MSAYDSVQKGGLKLKGVSDHGSKKKKKKDRQKEKLKDAVELQQEFEDQITSESPMALPTATTSRKTKAEISFEKRKWQKMEEQLAERASKSHKHRITEFNAHLDSLSEHFDIPKVSWTK